MKKIFKLIIIILLLTTMTFLVNNNTYARHEESAGGVGGGSSGIREDDNNILSWNVVPGLDPRQSLTATILQITGTIIKLIRNLIIIGSVLAIAVIGIQTIMGSADPEKKAGYQKKLLNIAIIAVFTASIFSIVSFIFDYYP